LAEWLSKATQSRGAFQPRKPLHPSGSPQDSPSPPSFHPLLSLPPTPAHHYIISYLSLLPSPLTSAIPSTYCTPAQIMSSQRYQAIPDSPPPSFRSRESSPSSAHHDRIYTENDPLTSDADRELADTFDSPSDDEDEEVDDTDERQGLTGGNGEASAGNDDGNQNTEATQSNPPRRIERRITQLPVFIPRTGRVYGGGNANDGVFSNLAAKPARGEAEDEKPPVSTLPIRSVPCHAL